MTERPSRLAIIAMSEPPKPEPTTAMSKSTFIRGGTGFGSSSVIVADACPTWPAKAAYTRHPRQDDLPQVHLKKPRSPLLETFCAVRKCLQIPQIGKNASAV